MTIVPFWEIGASTSITSSCEAQGVTASESCSRARSGLQWQLRRLGHSDRFLGCHHTLDPGHGRGFCTNSGIAQSPGTRRFQSSQQSLHQLASALRVSLDLMQIALGSAVRWQLPFHHLRVQQHAGQYVVQSMQYLGAIVAPTSGTARAHRAAYFSVTVSESNLLRRNPFAAIRTLKCIHDLSTASSFLLVHSLI